MHSPATTDNGHGPADPLVDDTENSSHRFSSQPIGSRVASKRQQRTEPLPLEPLTSPDRTMGINSVPYPQRLEPVKIPLKPDNIIVFTIKSLSITEVISVLNRARCGLLWIFRREKKSDRGVRSLSGLLLLGPLTSSPILACSLSFNCQRP